MFVYEKRLQYPIRIKQTNPKLAKIIVTQYGGAHFKCYKKGDYSQISEIVTKIFINKHRLNHPNTHHSYF